MQDVQRLLKQVDRIKHVIVNLVHPAAAAKESISVVTGHSGLASNIYPTFHGAMLHCFITKQRMVLTYQSVCCFQVLAVHNSSVHGHFSKLVRVSGSNTGGLQ